MRAAITTFFKVLQIMFKIPSSWTRVKDKQLLAKHLGEKLQYLVSKYYLNIKKHSLQQTKRKHEAKQSKDEIYFRQVRHQIVRTKQILRQCVFESYSKDKLMPLTLQSL